jgi:hypothetical protein
MPLNRYYEDKNQQAKVGLSFQSYANNPVGFAKDILRVDLTPDQELILDTLKDSAELNVPSAHGQGKTYLGSVAVIWWVFAVRGLAVTTAPTGRQTKELLWGEIRKLHGANQASLGGVCQTLALKLDENSRALGFSSADTDENAAQGFHAQNLLIVEDESCGISRAVDDGLTACLTGENNKILRIGNPVASGTPFHLHCLHKHIRLDAWRHPNVSWAYQLESDGIHRLKPEVRMAVCNPDGTIKPQSQWPDWCPRDVVPGAISLRWIEDVRSKKTETSFYWMSRVEARFPQDSKESIIPMSLLQEARYRYDSNPRAWDIEALKSSFRYGIDVGDGGDDSAIAIWRGNVLYFVEVLPGKNDRSDISRLCGHLIRKIKIQNTDIYGARIAVDRIGVGAGLVSMLLEQGFNPEGVHWGEKAEDNSQFQNLKTEQLWKFREALQSEEIAIAPLGEAEDLLFDELSNIYFDYTSTGKIRVEPKEKTKSRLGHSPNLADATIYGFSLQWNRQQIQLAYGETATSSPLAQSQFSVTSWSDQVY